MSNIAKTGIALIVIILIAIAGWMWYARSSSAPAASSASASAVMDESASASNTPAMSSPSDDSNAGLEQDMFATDAQMNGLDSDSANVDQSTTQPSGTSQ